MWGASDNYYLYLSSHKQTRTGRHPSLILWQTLRFRDGRNVITLPNSGRHARILSHFTVASSAYYRLCSHVYYQLRPD